MELTTLEETEQPIFGRTKLTLTATFDASVPSRGVIVEKLSSDRNADPHTIAIRTIKSRFGGGHATIEAYVYQDAQRLALIEEEHIVQRTKKTMPKPETAAPSEDEENAASEGSA